MIFMSHCEVFIKVYQFFSDGQFPKDPFFMALKSRFFSYL